MKETEKALHVSGQGKAFRGDPLARYYTPPEVARKIAEKALGYAEKLPLELKELLVVDPCAGRGHLLAPFAENGFTTLGYDIDYDAVANPVRENLNLVCGDFEETAAKMYRTAIIVANPPYGIPMWRPGTPSRKSERVIFWWVQQEAASTMFLQFWLLPERSARWAAEIAAADAVLVEQEPLGEVFPGTAAKVVLLTLFNNTDVHRPFYGFSMPALSPRKPVEIDWNVTPEGVKLRYRYTDKTPSWDYKEALDAFGQVSFERMALEPAKWVKFARTITGGGHPPPNRFWEYLGDAVERYRQSKAPLWPLRGVKKLASYQEGDAVRCIKSFVGAEEGEIFQVSISSRQRGSEMGDAGALTERQFQVRCYWNETLFILSRGRKELCFAQGTGSPARRKRLLPDDSDDRTFSLETLVEHFELVSPLKPIAESRADDYKRLKRELRTLTKGWGLYDYQVEGVVRMAMQGSGILAWDVGLGKSRGALALIKLLKVPAALILTPPGIMKTFTEEAAKVGVTVHAFRKPGEEDLRTIIKLVCADGTEQVIVLLPHNYVSRKYGSSTLAEELEKLFPCVIIDELHYFKNPSAERTKALQWFRKCHHRYGLTATPMKGWVTDLYEGLRFVMPGELFPYTRTEFAKAFGTVEVTPYRNKQGEVKERIKLKPVVHDAVGLWHILSSHLERRTKIETGRLPVLTFNTCKLPMTPAQIETYRWQRDNFTAWYTTLKRLHGPQAKMQAVAAQLWKLRRAATFPSSRLLENPCDANEVGNKERRIVKLVKKAAEKHRQVLVFTGLQDFAEALQERLRKEGFTVTLMNGSVTIHKRDEARLRFQQNEIDVLICGLTASSEGVTLTAASEVIFADCDWTPGIMTQAIGRAHRLTQERDVTVHLLLSAGSVDDYVWNLVQRKGQDVNVVVEGVFGKEEQSDTSLFNLVEKLLYDRNSQLEGLKEEVGTIQFGGSPSESQSRWTPKQKETLKRLIRELEALPFNR